MKTFGLSLPYVVSSISSGPQRIKGKDRDTAHDNMGKFIIKKAGNAGVMFNLLANNSQVICTSQTYSSKAACKNGIESIRKNANVAIEDQTLRDFEPLTNPKYEIYLDKGGEFRFRLKASNGEIIAGSQGYTSKVNCKNGIESIRNNAPDATIEDETKPEKAETKPEPKPETKNASKEAAKPGVKKTSKPDTKKPAAKKK